MVVDAALGGIVVERVIDGVGYGNSRTEVGGGVDGNPPVVLSEM